MSPTLQLALDFIDLDRAIEVIDRTRAFVDCFEIGTPLVLNEGLRAVRAIADAFPSIELLADTKIVDGGYREALSAFDAGARFVTVLAIAEPQTIAEVARAARERGGTVVADLIAARDPLGAAAAAVENGAAVLCVHRSTDAGTWGEAEARLVRTLNERFNGTRVMIAGGLDRAALPAALALEPDIVVVGRGILDAADPRLEAQRIRRILTGEAEA